MTIHRLHTSTNSPNFPLNGIKPGKMLLRKLTSLLLYPHISSPTVFVTKGPSLKVLKKKLIMFFTEMGNMSTITDVP